MSILSSRLCQNASTKRFVQPCPNGLALATKLSSLLDLQISLTAVFLKSDPYLGYFDSWVSTDPLTSL